MSHPKYKNYQLFPLTSPQKDIWNHLHASNNYSLYNLGVYVSIRGIMNFEIFQKSINRILRKHDTLRIRLLEINGEPYQYFIPTVKNIVQYLDISKKENSFNYLLQWMNNDCVKPFTLHNANLFNYTLVKCDRKHFVWYLKLHHITIDGWGNSLIFDDVFKTYNTLIDNKKVVFDSGLSYITFIQSEMEYQNSLQYKEDIEYWRHKYAHTPYPLKQQSSIPLLDNTTPKTSSKYGSFILKRELYDQIIAALKTHNLSGFKYALGITSLLLCTVKNRNELIIGALVLNREKDIFKKIAGLFYNEIPLRITVNQSKTVLSFLKAIKREVKENYKHQRLSKGQISTLLLGTEYPQKNLIDVSLSYTIFNHEQQFQDFETETVVFHQNQNLNNFFIFIDANSKYKDILISFEDQNDILEDFTVFNTFIQQFKYLFTTVWKNLESTLSECVSPLVSIHQKS